MSLFFCWNVICGDFFPRSKYASYWCNHAMMFILHGKTNTNFDSTSKQNWLGLSNLHQSIQSKSSWLLSLIQFTQMTKWVECKKFNHVRRWWSIVINFDHTWSFFYDRSSLDIIWKWSSICKLWSIFPTKCSIILPITIDHYCFRTHWLTAKFGHICSASARILDYYCQFLTINWC